MSESEPGGPVDRKTSLEQGAKVEEEVWQKLDREDRDKGEKQESEAKRRRRWRGGGGAAVLR